MMCRLGFISLKHTRNLTDLVKYSTIHYGKYNSHGTGFAYLDALVSDNLTMRKSGSDASKFWTEQDNTTQILSKMAIFHTRFASQGAINNDNAHPFVNEDNTIALVHNGTLHNYERCRTYLKDRGHIFTSSTDSEVALHAFEEWGKSFIFEMSNHGVDGWATFLILDSADNAIYAWTNSSQLVFYMSSVGIYGFSDTTIIGEHHAVRAAENTFYKIRNGKIVMSTKTADFLPRVQAESAQESCNSYIPASYRYASYNIGLDVQNTHGE